VRGSLGNGAVVVRPTRLPFPSRSVNRYQYVRAGSSPPSRTRAVQSEALETGAFVHAVLVDDALEQHKVATHYARHLAARTVALPRRPARAQEGRLRVGYLSADFHQHATSQLTVQMFEAHDRSRFEVTLFSAGPDDASPMRARIEAAAEHFENLRGQSHEAMARRIRELGIDILVDVKGATHGTLMPVTAHRAGGPAGTAGQSAGRRRRERRRPRPPPPGAPRRRCRRRRA